MLEQEGVVVSVEARICVVEFGGASSCRGCDAACHAQTSNPPRRLTLSLPENLPLRPGDCVSVAVAAPRVLLAASTLYLGSPLALFLGAGLAEGGAAYLGSADSPIAAFSGALVVFASYLLAMRKWRWIERMTSAPVIVGRREPAPVHRVELEKTSGSLHE